MRIREIHLKNLGPISDVTIEPRLSEVGHHVPIAIVGQNGAGKSLALSAILDAMTEARRSSFTEIQEVNGNEFIRISSKNYIQNSKSHSHVSVKITTETGEIVFNELVSRIPNSDFIAENPVPDLLPALQSNEFQSSGFYKHVTISDPQKNTIRTASFLYFPYFRYEPPYWMSETANVNFVKNEHFYGRSKINPVRTHIIEETKRWILNVLLDRELYERRLEYHQVDSKTSVPSIGYAGPNTQLFALVNEVVSTMLRAKNSSIFSARIGISQKGKREIVVFATKHGQAEEIVAPDISQLSSGELMTLGLATEIIRTYELVKGVPPHSLDEVTGVVLIDEIDLHLHISFQKDVLPRIIRRFPNVQFIFTTHSPFFLLGMTESGDIDIYNFPIGNKIHSEEFEEFKLSYEVFTHKNEQYRHQYEEIRSESERETRPLIITEGKTDWIHLKFMLSKLKQVGKYTEIDVDFHEYGSEIEMGDIRLKQMCEHFASLPQRRRIIFLFDRDNPVIIKSMAGSPADFKCWGNNVYSLCIPIPAHRTEYNGISIELYYSEQTLQSRDPESLKRLWFSNEVEIITQATTGSKLFKARRSANLDDELLKKVFDQPADKIVDDEGKFVGLSKFAFATSISTERIDISQSDTESFSDIFRVIHDICRNSAAENAR